MATTFLRTRSLLRGRHLVLALGFGASALACDKEKFFPKPLPPAPYVQSAVGTVFRYAGFTNRVVSNDGWRTRFVDDSGRANIRIAGFITEDPAHPAVLDTAKLSQLWPLKVGNAVNVPLSIGAERWAWHIQVTGEQQIETPSGIYRTFVVEALQERTDSAAGPRVSFAYTFNYAPEVKTVARFQTTVSDGKDEPRTFGGDLRSIYHPDDALVKP